MNPLIKDDIWNQQVKVYNILKETILSEFNNINKYNREKGSSNTKVIIAGGCAFEYYFNNIKGTALETHDFDARVCYTGENFDIPIIQNLYIERNRIALYLTRKLNQELMKNTENSKILREHILTNENNEYFFISQNSLLQGDYAFLRPIHYVLKDNEGNYHEDSLIDLVIDDRTGNSIGFREEYLSKPNINLYNDYFKKERPDRTFISSEASIGFFKNDITLPKSYNNIGPLYPQFNETYIVSMSFLIWDSLRMLNISVITMKNIKESTLPESDKILKIKNMKTKRYISKYSEILRALNNPEIFLSCYAPNMTRYIQKCYDENSNIGKYFPSDMEDKDESFKQKVYPNKESVNRIRNIFKPNKTIQKRNK
jgi:hypothetical protein